MSGTYKGLNQILNGSSVTMTPNATTALTGNLPLDSKERGHLLVKVVLSGVIVAGSVTVKLQDSFNGGATWEDVKTAAVTVSGNYELTNNINNGTDGLIWPLVRVVLVSTNAGDTATATAVWAARSN